MKKTIISLLAIVLAFNLSAQKPPIDHSVYDGWNRIGYIGVPYSKDWVTYQVMPQEGDATLYYLNLLSGTSYSFERAAHAAITPDCKYALIKVSPAYAQVKELKRKKTKEDKMPKDTLLLLNLATGQTTSYPDVKDYKLPEKMERFVAFRLSQPHVVPAADTTAAVPDSLKAAKPIPDSLKAVTPKEGAEGARAPKAAPDKKKEKPDESWKTDLLVLDILSGAVDTIKMVDSFYWVPDGSRIVYSRKPADKDTVYTRGLYVYTPADGASKDIVTTPNKKAYISSVSFSNKYKYMTFMAGLDTAKSAEKDYSAYVYDWNELREVISSKDSRIPEGFTLSKNRALSFDANCTRAYFGLAPKLPEKDTTLRDDERGKLDIWTWNEEFLHSEQRFMAGKIKDLNYACHIPFDGEGDLVMLEEDGIQGVTPRVTNTHDYVLVTSNKPYRLQRQWNTEDKNDLYRIRISDGSREKLMTEVPIRLVGSSPDGRWYVWYDFAKQCFFQYDIESGTSVDVTSAIDDIFFDDLHDTPSVAGPISGASWEADSKAYYIQSKYDVWKFDPTGKKAPVCVTQGKGKATRTVYRITADIFSKAHIDRDYRGYLQPGDPLWFQTFNEESKENGLATINMTLRKPQLQTLQQGPWTYSSMLGSRATKKPTFVSVRGNFESGNNLWIYRNMFASEEKITDINPQQADYRWGSVELVKWTTYNGHPAEGILYTPDDIDSTKKYPVIVYFYERMSQE
ncbi:MAG: hypothetical protein HUJ91_07575, partial [Bacteroidales bacterium]|nr:hypothetical protein [Bacteroidales bacterium]